MERTIQWLQNASLLLNLVTIAYLILVFVDQSGLLLIVALLIGGTMILRFAMSRFAAVITKQKWTERLFWLRHLHFPA